jgi:PTS system nitrogen regulatory IIA component
MRLIDLLTRGRTTTDLAGTNKTEVLLSLAGLLCDQREGLVVDDVFRALCQREELASTGIGVGVGVPHGRVDTVDEVLVALGVHRRGVDFSAPDGKHTGIFFAVLAPVSKPGVHLKVLARISRLVRAEQFRENLRFAEDQSALLDAVRGAEMGIS